LKARFPAKPEKTIGLAVVAPAEIFFAAQSSRPRSRVLFFVSMSLSDAEVFSLVVFDFLEQRMLKLCVSSHQRFIVRWAFRFNIYLTLSNKNF